MHERKCKLQTENQQFIPKNKMQDMYLNLIYMKTKCNVQIQNLPFMPGNKMQGINTKWSKYTFNNQIMHE